MREPELFDSSSHLGQPNQFPSNEHDASLRWQAFKAVLSKYGAERNRVIPGHPYVSRLSPAVRSRLLLESDVIESALQTYAFSTVEKFVQEVLWRSYWKAWLENRPEIWAAYREELQDRQETISDEVRARVQEVENGRSGVALIDKFTQELRETGYMHNHARMWWASFWIHVEKLPWVLGADVFYRHLLDADPASNTLSWRWVAGLQTRGKTYLIRRSNLEKYCAEEYLADKAGLERIADGAVAPSNPQEWTIRGSREHGSGFDIGALIAQPKNNGKTRWGWWLHGEDLHVKSARSLLPVHEPINIQAFVSSQLCEQFNLGKPRVKYMEEALQDGFSRALALCDLSPGKLTHLHQENTLASAITQWAVQEQLEEVWALRPFVGPLRDELQEIARKLSDEGKKLCLVTRPWDTELLPLAKGGYFGFWERAKKKLRAV